MIMIVSICFSFNSSNMKTVNSMRAKYLSENEQVIDFALDISCMIETIFERYPSLFEILECDECEYLGSRKTSMVNLSEKNVRPIY